MHYIDIISSESRLKMTLPAEADADEAKTEPGIFVFCKEIV